MLELTKQLSEYSLFYNGPNCGASAPDHFHFQAGNKGFMPIEDEFQKAEKELLSSLKGCNTYALNHGFRKVLVLCGSDSLKLTMLFNHIMRIFSSYLPSDPEPMINIISLWQDEEWSIFVFPRQKHRPDQYFLSAKEQILLSPASVDFGGMLITPRQEDYEKLNKETIKDIFEQLSLEDKIWEAIKNELRD
jgi:ATP adenylyltransferase/5',5'''-P-1,P-4-tetraphosphate phosphorylase II